LKRKILIRGPAAFQPRIDCPFSAMVNLTRIYMKRYYLSVQM